MASTENSHLLSTRYQKSYDIHTWGVAIFIVNLKKNKTNNDIKLRNTGYIHV